jgi:hypothetical protein
MINHAGQINITQLTQLGYKPGRLIDIWEMAFGRQATGCCCWCQTSIHPMRIMRKFGGIRGCYPSQAECFIIVNARLYPGFSEFQKLTHHQRASIAGLVCQNCWLSVAGGHTLIQQ